MESQIIGLAIKFPREPMESQLIKIEVDGEEKVDIHSEDGVHGAAVEAIFRHLGSKIAAKTTVREETDLTFRFVIEKIEKTIVEPNDTITYKYYVKFEQKEQ